MTKAQLQQRLKAAETTAVRLALESYRFHMANIKACEQMVRYLDSGHRIRAGDKAIVWVFKMGMASREALRKAND